jgi:NitT/TauT family transport system permease protein
MKKILKTAILLISLIAIWGIAAEHSNPIFIPTPLKVLGDFIEVIKTGQLFKALQYSFLRITIATLISALISIPIGLFIYNVKIARDFVYPIVSAIRYVPVTAFYPLLIMWFGIDELMKIVFLFIATFVYMMPSVMLALDEVNPDLIDTGLTIGMSRLQTITQIQIPATLPSLMNSFIMMYGIGWTYISVAETVNAKYGLGFIIQQSSSRGRTDLVFMSIITIIIISVLFDTISKLLVKKIFKWRYLNDCNE